MLDAAEIAVLGVGAGVKLLLWPAYRSTDFEVHRNWLAITGSLPVREWYHEARSEWTLDYPPFFAWFEWALAHVARLWDPRIVDIDHLDYAAWSCVVFQRLTVLISELLLFLALRRALRALGASGTAQGRVAAALVYLGPGFLLVDHVHFQYNGFLVGILVYSLAFALEGRDLLAATAFAALLCFKHIFVYMAPAYFVYLLRHYCVGGPGGAGAGAAALRLAKLGSVVAAVFAVAFGPFVVLGQTQQLVDRLFPFRRGLCHAYWAPNFWALYVAIDRALCAVWARLPPALMGGAAGAVRRQAIHSATRGLVGDTQLAVLPDIPPLGAFVATLVALVPACAVLLRRQCGPIQLIQAVVLCAHASFLFGWHVHEKAVILIVAPFGLLVAVPPPPRVLRMHAVLSAAGFFGLLPLLFGAQELPLKAAMLLIWISCALVLLRANDAHRTTAWRCLARAEQLYIAGLVPLFAVAEVVPDVVFGRMRFLPLALVSVYTAVGVIYAWLGTAAAFR
ncbi:glycosyl transferase [Coemansia spiralis]|nr:glycosyl transferase [Coemansia spiralis]